MWCERRQALLRKVASDMQPAGTVRSKAAQPALQPVVSGGGGGRRQRSGGGQLALSAEPRNPAWQRDHHRRVIQGAGCCWRPTCLARSVRAPRLGARQARSHASSIHQPALHCQARCWRPALAS